MKITFLGEGSGTGRLLLIAAGWGTDSSFYKGTGMYGWDTAIVTLSGSDENAREIVDAVSHYKTIYLYAWSLGVAMGEVLFNAGLRPTASFAVAGTASPVSDSEGIPEDIYRSTCEQLTERSLYKFRCRMCGGSSVFRTMADKFVGEETNDIAILQRDLETTRNRQSKESLQWTRAFVCKRDAIFPPEAQTRHWRRREVPIKFLDSPHFVVMQEIVDYTVVNLPRTTNLFRRSALTYSSNAHAQRTIARRLASLVSEAYGKDSVNTFLEIGCGTGELSFALGDRLRIKDATFIDLCECELFGIAEEETYLEGDAELLVERMPDSSYDMICSSSAIQWFSDTCRFIGNCKRLLSPGGILALSTFTQGNLYELDSLRDTTLGYLSEERIKAIMGEFFKYVYMEVGIEQLLFPSANHLLRHLKLTGVTASTSKNLSPTQLRFMMKNLPVDSERNYTLTFRPVYIIAKD